MKNINLFEEFINEKVEPKDGWIEDKRYQVYYKDEWPWDSVPELPGCKKISGEKDLKVGSFYAIGIQMPHTPNYKYIGLDENWEFNSPAPHVFEHIFWEIKEPGEPLRPHEVNLKSEEVKEWTGYGMIQEHSAGKFKKDTWIVDVDGKEYKNSKGYMPVKL